VTVQPAAASPSAVGPSVKPAPRLPLRSRAVFPGGGQGEAREQVARVAPPAGETQVSEAFNDEAAAAGAGELLISTVPWSRVLIDGRDTGRDTPVRALRVPAGAHRIVLRTPDGNDHEVAVVVQPGRTVRIIRRFE